MKKLLILLIIPLLFSCNRISKKDLGRDEEIINNIFHSIIKEENHENILIEIYAKQFEWTVRYAGNDNVLGAAHVSAIHLDTDEPSANNPLGIITNGTILRQVKAISNTIKKDSLKLESEFGIEAKKIESKLLKDIKKRQGYIANFFSADEKGLLEQGNDDIIISAKDGKLILPKGKEIILKFRSQDVIHAAYMPHFKMEMNCVPGLSSQFAFTPTMTTKDYQGYLQNTAFTYILLCNKICGDSHYDMYMEVEVVEEEEYNTWIENQKTISDEIGQIDNNDLHNIILKYPNKNYDYMPNRLNKDYKTNKNYDYAPQSN